MIDFILYKIFENFKDVLPLSVSILTFLFILFFIKIIRKNKIYDPLNAFIALVATAYLYFFIILVFKLPRIDYFLDGLKVIEDDFNNIIVPTIISSRVLDRLGYRISKILFLVIIIIDSSIYYIRPEIFSLLIIAIRYFLDNIASLSLSVKEKLYINKQVINKIRINYQKVNCVFSC